MSDSSGQRVKREELDGNLYKFILGNTELSDNLYHIFKAWLDSAWEEFPICPWSCADCTLQSCLEDDFYQWFYKYFGVKKPNNSSSTTKTGERR